MTAIGRYAGRNGGPGIDDSLSGPETVERVFSADAVTIADPLSFPWSLVETEQWRLPVTVDLRGTSADDLVALAEPLPVLTPADHMLVDEERRGELGALLGLPPSVFLAEPTTESPAELDTRAAAKLALSLRREVLAPILVHELDLAAGPDDPRPLLVVDCGSPDDWHGSLVPDPHRYRRTEDLASVPSESAAVIMLAESKTSGADLRGAVDRLTPGGLVVLVLSAGTVARAAGPSMSKLLTTIG